MDTGFLNIHDMVLVLTLMECLFLASILRFIPAQTRQSRQLLSIFFCVLAGWIFSSLLIWNQTLQTLPLNESLFPTLLLSLCMLLQGPCLYFYLRSLSGQFSWRDKKLLLHLLPAVVVMTVIVVFHLNGPTWIPWAQLPQAQKLAVKFCWAVTRCSPLLYVVACCHVEYRLHQQYRQQYSSVSAVDIKLADVVLFGFLLHWLWGCFGYFIGGYISPAANNWIGIADNYLIALQVNGLFVLGVANTRSLLMELKLPEPADKNPPPIAEEKIALIEAAISDKKAYLESNINLERFSEVVGLKPREVSQIINQHYQVNFFEFINGLRVEEAMRLLVSPEFDHLTILEIIYQSGFNSQSAFQRFFKRLVGCSPGEYRRNTQKINEKG